MSWLEKEGKEERGVQLVQQIEIIKPKLHKSGKPHIK